MPSWLRSANRARRSRAPGGRLLSSAIDIPFTVLVAIFGNSRRNDSPSTCTTSNDPSSDFLLHGMRLASSGGRISFQSPSGSMKCESPE